MNKVKELEKELHQAVSQVAELKLRLKLLKQALDIEAGS